MNGGAGAAVYFFGAPAGRAASNRWTNAKATTASDGLEDSLIGIPDVIAGHPL